MLFHENGLLIDNSHEISYLFFFEIRKDLEVIYSLLRGKMSQNFSSAAVVIGALRVD